jgi:hypothetical protein
MSEAAILSTVSVQEYFRGLLCGAISNQRAPLGELTEFYLVDLLARFIEAEALYARGPDGSLEEEPLAFMLRRALEGDREQRISALRKLGDNSLYIAGFFADSLGRSLVDLDYYISMGGAAYGTLASLSRERRAGGAFATLYGELCQKFNTVVDLFAEISEQVEVSTNKGVVKVYERWLKTGSERMSRLMVQKGLIPAMTKPGMVQ